MLLFGDIIEEYVIEEYEYELGVGTLGKYDSSGAESHFMDVGFSHSYQIRPDSQVYIRKD